MILADYTSHSSIYPQITDLKNFLFFRSRAEPGNERKALSQQWPWLKRITQYKMESPLIFIIFFVQFIPIYHPHRSDGGYVMHPNPR